MFAWSELISLKAVAGEILEPISWQFRDEQGEPLELTSWTGWATWRTLTGRTGTVVGTVTGSEGTVTVQLPAESTARPGVVTFHVWAESPSGTIRMSSPAGTVQLAQGV